MRTFQRKGMKSIPSFTPQGVCPTKIEYDIEAGIVKNVRFTGDVRAISKQSGLVEGMPAEEVIKKFKGIICRNQTSCTDQLARALEAHIE